jgi:hypothetical protein
METWGYKLGIIMATLGATVNKQVAIFLIRDGFLEWMGFSGVGILAESTAGPDSSASLLLIWDHNAFEEVRSVVRTRKRKLRELLAKSRRA